MISSDKTMIDELLEQPYWIVDILPVQVPAYSQGKYAEFEQYYLQEPQLSQLRRKYLALLLKLNCYYDLSASIDGGDHWTKNPKPQLMESWLVHDENIRVLHVMMAEQNTLLVMDFCDTYMTVYHPQKEALQTLGTLADSEGLFIWQPSRSIRCHRIYDKPAAEGYRILVDKLWPRGIKKEDAVIDLWMKDIAPSNDLRKWFGHDPEKYDEFAAGYRKELDASPSAAEFAALCRDKLAAQDVILLYAAKDEEHNNAVVLREWLLEKLT